jgi:hypothetical protein
VDDEHTVNALEAAIADLGSLLVRLEKYRRGRAPDATALQHEAMVLGDRARRASRSGALDDAAAARLQAEAGQLVGRVREILAEVHDAPAYRAALEAHAVGDHATLARTLPTVFAGLEPVTAPLALFRPVAWRRRNRPRPAPDLVAEVASLVSGGLIGEGDDLAPGVDPALPAIVLETELPLDEPVVLRIAGPALGVRVHRLEATGEHLVHAARLRVPFTVLLARDLDPDALESTPLDYARWRAEIATALTAAGIGYE